MIVSDERGTEETPMIEVSDLKVGWGTTVLMENVSFRVARGEIFVILGASGCGKSTLLRHLMGLEVPMAGTIRVAGASVEGPLLGNDAPPPYGVLFQSGALFGSMTLMQNVALPLQTWTDLSDGVIEQVCRSKLGLVGLEGAENHLPSEISGGMRKRAGIARALALEPEILFLDEPSAGLDPITAVELDDLILLLSRTLGTTIAIVTHELESIFKIADRCIMLDKQVRGVVAEGDPRQLRDEPRSRHVRAFFNRQPLDR